MKAAILAAPHDMTLQEVGDPVASTGDLILRVKAATICGTDIRILRGRKTAGVRYPSIIGHEFSGQVVQTGGRSAIGVGQRVVVCPFIPCSHCLPCRRGRENLCRNSQAFGYQIDGAFAEYIRIPARLVEMGSVHSLPDTLSYEEAALIEPLACVLNGQDKLGLGPGDTVVILGAGPIGLLHVKLARLRGAARIIVSQPSADRRHAAMMAGADVTLDPTEGNLRARVRDETQGLGADVVICATGLPELAAEAVALAAPGGRISLFAGFTDGTGASLDVNTIHYGELCVTGASGLSRRNFAEAFQLMKSNRIEVASLVTHRYGLAEMEAAFAMAEGRGALKVAIIDE